MHRNRNYRIILYISIPVILIAFIIIFALTVHKGYVEPAAPDSVVIAIPYSESVQDYDTNYYTGWLEAKTGYDITFTYLDEGYEAESFNLMLTSDNGNVDAVFFPANQEIISFEDYRNYINAGVLAAPQDYLSGESCLAGIKEAYPDMDFGGLVGNNGKMYCFPSLDLSRSGRNSQILWINIDWLANLNLAMPQTVDELNEVLAAFGEKDPNGNGIKDELPLISCEAEASFRSYMILFNAFTYYDGERLPWYEKGTDTPEEEAFREGIAYCAKLYAQGMMAKDCFNYTKKQLMELVNDPEDTVGAFASHSIADAVYTNNPGVLAHFVQLAPLSSDFLERGYAVRTEICPDIGGIIPANAAHKAAAAQIMDVMLSKEASLIALYGEEGVDWRFSQDGELSIYGTRAMVTTIRYIKGERQNKNYAGAGPLLAAAEYTDGVTWNGDHSRTEYIDARAVKTYEDYYFTEDTINTRADLYDGAKSTVSVYLDTEILRFITGELDIENDSDWEDFLTGYGRIAD